MRVKPGDFTDKQRVFILTYIDNPNATKAAIAAGYSPQTARSIGSENLKKTAIAAAIKDGFSQREAEHKIATGVIRDWLLTRLVMAVDADTKDLFYSNGNPKPIHEWPNVFRNILVRNYVIKSTSKIVNNEEIIIDRNIKISLFSREKFMRLLGDHRRIRAFVRNGADLADKTGVSRPSYYIDELSQKYAKTI